jgi:N-acetylmuramoyl-L-alanine amidase
MKQLIIIAFAFFSISYNYALSDSTKITLVIDAGHGGKDPGNLASNPELLNEKEINLKIALKFGEYVEAFLGHQVNVLYTREKDTFIELNDRILFANDHKANYFISIHCNSSKNINATGVETHINDLERNNSLELAHTIQREFVAHSGRNSRGVKLKEDRLYNLMVLKYTHMAAVLVESGFMTNTEEELFLNSEYGQDIIASSVFRAFKEFVELKHGIKQQKPTDKSLRPKYVGTIYKIQLSTSTEKLDTTAESFQKIDHPIEVEETETNGKTTYKYLAGEFFTEREAKKELKIIQKNTSFKFAFVVKVE